MLSERCWQIHWCTSQAYLLCIGVFTLPLQQIFCSPSVPQSVHQGKPTVCFSVFSKTLHVWHINDTAGCNPVTWLDSYSSLHTFTWCSSTWFLAFTILRLWKFTMMVCGAFEIAQQKRGCFFFFFLTHFLCVLCCSNGALVASSSDEDTWVTAKRHRSEVPILQHRSWRVFSK